jgi:uncharacterized protein
MSATIRVPFDVGPAGRIGFADSDYDVANQYMKNLLLTRFGERVMRPSYGSRLRDNVFEPIGEVMEAELDGDIRDAIRTWEPAVEVHQIEFTDFGSTLEIDLQYTLGDTLGARPARVQVSIAVGGNVEEQQ